MFGPRHVVLICIWGPEPALISGQPNMCICGSQTCRKHGWAETRMVAETSLWSRALITQRTRPSAFDISADVGRMNSIRIAIEVVYGCRPGCERTHKVRTQLQIVHRTSASSSLLCLPFRFEISRCTRARFIAHQRFLQEVPSNFKEWQETSSSSCFHIRMFTFSVYFHSHIDGLTH